MSYQPSTHSSISPTNSGYPSAYPTIAVSTDYSIYMIVPSAFSVVGSASVVLTFIVFRSHLRKKAYMEILLYIFISNMLTAAGSSVGLPADKSYLCWFQGIFTNIFTLSSCLWTIQIPILLIKVINSKDRGQLSVRLHSHLICWGIPIIATFIPLSNATYGSPPGWCWIVETENSPPWALDVWFWISYYLWIWLTLITLLCLFSYIAYKLHGIHKASLENFRRMYYDLAGYNLIIFICWMLSCLYDFLLTYNNDDYSALQIPTYILSTSMGFLGSILFWYRAVSLRKKWIEILKKNFPKFGAKIVPENENPGQLYSWVSGRAASEKLGIIIKQNVKQSASVKRYAADPESK